MNSRSKWAAGLLLLSLVLAGFAVDPYREIKLYINNPKEPFVVNTFVGDTTEVRARLFTDGTNAFDGTGWVFYLRYAEDIDKAQSLGMPTITGSVSTTTVTFTPVSNYFFKAIKNGFASVHATKVANGQKTTFSHGTLNVEASPEGSSVGLPSLRS